MIAHFALHDDDRRADESGTMPSMQDRPGGNTVRIAILTMMVAVWAATAAAQSKGETYPFTDEITGLTN